MEEKLFELMTKMYSEMQQGFSEVRTEIRDVKTEVGINTKEIQSLKQEVKVNTLELETVNSKLNKIAELQVSFQDQIKSESNNIKKDVADKISLLELAVRRNKEDLDKGLHEIEKYLH